MPPLTLLLNWRLWAAALVAIALAASHWKVYKIGQKEGLDTLAAYRLEQSQQTVKLLEKRDADTRELQDNYEVQRKAKNHELSRLNSDLADANQRLRDRPERASESSSPVAAASCSATGATGATLFREDAAFLNGEAARADQIRLDLIECQAAYDSARQKLK